MCSLIERDVQQLTLKIAPLPDEASVRIAARRNISAMQPCLAANSPTVNQLMVAAANYRLLGRSDDAVALYQRALELDQRPELYLNLGLAQIEAGHAKPGIDNIVSACIFNPDFLDEISIHHDEIKKQVDQYQIDMEERRKRVGQ